MRHGGVAPSRPSATARDPSRLLLRLYVTGTTAGSVRAIHQVRRVCDEPWSGRYDLEVIDIYRRPSLARDHQIIATPTLIKVLPAPLRRLIGDLSSKERIFLGLGLAKRAAGDPPSRPGDVSTR